MSVCLPQGRDDRRSGQGPRVVVVLIARMALAGAGEELLDADADEPVALPVIHEVGRAAVAGKERLQPSALAVAVVADQIERIGHRYGDVPFIRAEVGADVRLVRAAGLDLE